MFSISDFELIAKYSWKVYKACKGASSDFEEISGEALALHVVLKELEDAARDPTSLINRPAVSKKQELSRTIRHCRKLLDTIEKLVGKYHSLGTDKERLWDLMRFGTEELGPLRSKLRQSVANLNLFLQTLETSSLARIEALLEKLIEEVRSGRKAPTVLSSVLDDTSVGWPQLKNELTTEGIPKADIEIYKGSIQAWIREANEEGLFDDPDPGVSTSKSIRLRPLSFRALSISSAGSDRDPIEEPRVSIESESQRASITVGNEDGHDDAVSVGGIAFSRPIELRPLSVRYSTKSREQSRPPTSSTEPKGAPVLSPAVVETDPGIATPKATTSVSTPIDEDMPRTAQPNLSLPSTARHYKNSSTSMGPDEQTSREHNEGYLSVPAMSLTPANSTKDISDDAPGDVSINTEGTLKNSTIVEPNATPDTPPPPNGSFWDFCGDCQCCSDDVLNDVHAVPARPGVIR